MNDHLLHAAFPPEVQPVQEIMQILQVRSQLPHVTQTSLCSVAVDKHLSVTGRIQSTTRFRMMLLGMSSNCLPKAEPPLVQAAARIAPVSVPPPVSDGRPWNGNPMGSVAATSADGTGPAATAAESAAAAQQQGGGAADATPAVMPSDGGGRSQQYSSQQQPQLPS